MLKTLSMSPFRTTSVSLSSREKSANATLSSTKQATASSIPTDSLKSTLLTKTTHVETYTMVVSANVSATPSSQILPSSEVTASTKILSAIPSSASDQSVVVLTQTSIASLETSQNRTFTAVTVAITAAAATTATVQSVNVSATASPQMRSSILVPTGSTSEMASLSPLRPSSTEHVTTSSSTVIPPGIFVRFVISVPVNESVNDVSFKANLTRGIAIAYENGSLDGLSGNASINVSTNS